MHPRITNLMKTCALTIISGLLLVVSPAIGQAQPPQVVSISPAHHAVNIPENSDISVTFDIAMDETTIDGSSFRVYSKVNGWRSGAITYDDVSYTATFTAGSEFGPGDVITVILTMGIESDAGQSLGAGYVWSFTIITEATGGDYGSGPGLYAIEAPPEALFVADFDGDGDADIVTANESAGSISILLNDGDGTYSTHQDTYLGFPVYSVSAADIDGDGDLDVAAGRGFDFQLSILFNNGDATFDYSTTYPLAGLDIVMADLDGDGDIDVASCSNSSWYGNMYVMLNIGDGTFAPHTLYKVGDWAYAITAADLDNDGDLDLATANNGASNTISIRFNDGTGNFETHVEHSAGVKPVSLTAGDLDGDGDADLAVTDKGTNKVLIFTNPGDGDMAYYAGFPTGDEPESITAADFDGDGDLDLATANEISRDFSILLNSGAANFSIREDYAAGGRPRFIVAEDLDGNGAIDVITANTSAGDVGVSLNKIRLLSNVSEITFAAHVNGPNPPDQFFNLGPNLTSIAYDITVDADWLSLSQYSGMTPAAIAVSADISGLHGGRYEGTITITAPEADNSPQTIAVVLELYSLVSLSPAPYALDIPTSTTISAIFDEAMDGGTITGSSFLVHSRVAGHVPGSIDYDAGSQTATFSPATEFIEGDQITAILTTAILTAEGYPLIKSHVWPFTIATESRRGSFGPEGTEYPVGASPLSVCTADFDGDGDMDVVTANFESGNVSLLFNDGSGTFGPSASYSVEATPYGVIAADLDNDGDLDVATVNKYPASTTILFNDGLGVMVTTAHYSLGWDAESLHACDLDGDGNLDLAVTHYNQDNVSILRNNGFGVFNANYTIPTGDGPNAVVSGDFDLDGDLDLATSNQISESISILFNDGNVSFGAPVDYQIGGSYDYIGGICAADFNGDGYPDVAVVRRGRDLASLLLNNGDGTFSEQGDYPVGDAPVDLAAADIDGDGDIDLVAANEDSDNIMILHNAGDGTFEPGDVIPAGVHPTALVAGDLNGDGALDLVTANGASNDITVMLQQLLLLVDVSEMAFEAVAGGPNPSDQIFTLESNDGGTVEFAISDDTDWLSVSAATGTTPASITVTIDISNLVGGHYAADITISSPEVDNSPQTIHVSLDVYHILSTSPPAHAISAPLDTDISVTFGVDMDETTIDASSFYVYSRALGFRSGSITYDQPTHTATFTPNAAFPEGDNVTAMLTTDIQTAEGGALLQNRSWSFTTLAGVARGDYEPEWDNYAVGSNPFSICAADVNGDGNLDLITANESSNNISVQMNTGDGTFEPQQTYATAIPSGQVCAADLDNDGDLDVVTGSRNAANVSVLFNAGDGAFAPPVIYNLADRSTSVCAADLDGDGDIDVAACGRSNQGGNVYIMFNIGNGIFAPYVTYMVGNDAQAIIAADLDSDGDFDLATAGGYISNNISVLLNEGNGSFSSQGGDNIGLTLNAMCVGDYNGDGHADLAATARTYDRLLILLNQGNGTFVSTAQYTVGDSPYAIFSADVDGDGILDLITPNQFSDNLSVLEGAGNGTFINRGSYTVGDGPVSVIAADLDGNHVLDLATANWDGHTTSVRLNRLLILPEKTSFEFGATAGGDNPDIQMLNMLSNGIPVNFSLTDDADWLTLSAESSTTPTTITLAADITGLSSGLYSATIIMDAPEAENSPPPIEVTLILNQMLTVFPAHNALGVPLPSEITVTFDEEMDESTINQSSFLVTSRALGHLAGTVLYHPHTLTATFSPAAELIGADLITAVVTTDVRTAAGAALQPGYTWSFYTETSNSTGSYDPSGDYATGGEPGAHLAADLDGDGDLDLAIPNSYDDNVIVLLNDGYGAFPTSTTVSVGDGPRTVVAADFDRDGDLDLATANQYSENVSVLMNMGSATFPSSSEYQVGVSWSYTNGLHAADLDGDGDIDLAASKRGSNNIAVLSNKGNGTFEFTGDYDVGAGPFSVTSADVDNDGDLDLITPNAWQNHISIRLNNGRGAFPEHRYYQVGGEPYGIGAGDFNGDGYVDLATACASQNKVSILLNDGNGSLAERYDYPVGAEPYSIFTVDLDGDGDLDLTTANASSTTITVLYNAGDGSFAELESIPTAYSRWSIIAADFDGNQIPDLAAISVGARTASILLKRNTLLVEPTSLCFEGIVSEHYPPHQKIIIESNGNPLPYIIAVDAAWLTTIQSSGTTPDTVAVWANTDGLEGGQYSGTITITSPEADNQPQVVDVALSVYHIVSITPLPHTLNVPLNSEVSVTFGSAMDESTITGGSFAVYSRATGFCAGTINFDQANQTATFSPHRAFNSGDMITVILTPSIQTTTGIPMLGRNTWSFTTVSGRSTEHFESSGFYGVGISPLRSCIADLDQDGDLDVVASNEGSDNISVLVNNGDGTFLPQSTYHTGDYCRSVCAADLDGDGDMDLATANAFGYNISVLSNNGDATFAPAISYAVDNMLLAICAADLDGDGDIDLAACGNGASYGTCYVFPNDGTGAFAPFSLYETGSYANDIISDDLDDDGDIDLATANRLSNTISVLLNTGNGEFADNVEYATGEWPIAVCSGDFDGDGDPDMATANEKTNNASIYYNDGNGNFADHAIFPLNDMPQSIVTADIDGDGDLDLLTGDHNSLLVSILHNDGSGKIFNRSILPVGGSPRMVNVADINGDGMLDLISVLDESEELSMFLNSPYCDCANFCDLNLDGRINPIDIVIFVQYVYGGSDGRLQMPYCPLENGDWDCFGYVNPVDVVWMVNYVYQSSGMGPCNPCE